MAMDLSAFVDAAAPLRALGVVVTQEGREVASHLWEAACRRNIYSASKSVTATAVGIAAGEGLLSLEERLVDVFKDDLPQTVGENLEKAVVRDLLTMHLGQGSGYLMGADRPYYADPDWVKTALAQPFADPPNSRFVYNNAGPYLAGILVQRRAGCDLVNYLTPRLFAPMGISRPTWETDPLGNTFGAGGLFLTLWELHKLGQLWLQHGSYNGRQLAPAAFMAEALSRQTDNDRDSFGYGYLFWGGDKGSFRADGKYGQFAIMMPDKDAVVTITAECREEPKLLDAVFTHIYSQL